MDEENQQVEVNEAAGEGEGQPEQVAEDYDFQGLQERLEIVANELYEAAATGHGEEELDHLERQVDDSLQSKPW